MVFAEDSDIAFSPPRGCAGWPCISYARTRQQCVLRAWVQINSDFSLWETSRTGQTSLVILSVAKLSRIAGVSKARARRRNPEREAEGAALKVPILCKLSLVLVWH